MDILSIVQLDSQKWPYAVMAFLRIITLFFFLPIFGEQIVPLKLRITLALAFTFFVYAPLSGEMRSASGLLQWNGLTLCLIAAREVFFGFAAGYAARLLMWAAAVAAQAVGVNMGFQVASMFSPMSSEHESPFSVLKNWLVIMILLAGNVHHIFLEGLVNSFRMVPVGPHPHAGVLLKIATLITTSAFELGIRLAAPLITVQVLVNVSLGILNRTMPMMNVFAVSFPVGFLSSMLILIFGISACVSLLTVQGLYLEASWFRMMLKAFFMN